MFIGRGTFINVRGVQGQELYLLSFIKVKYSTFEGIVTESL